MKPTGTPWKVYLRNGLGQRLSTVGEKIGFHWLTYNPWVMQHFHDDAVVNAPKVVNAISAMFPEARSVLDVGAGSGAIAAEFARRKFATLACENSAHGRKLAQRQGVDCRPFDLSLSPPASVAGAHDLICCFEVAEHVPPDMGLRLVEFLASFSGTLIFTAAQPGQGGTGHINEQPLSYWRERFVKAGRTPDETASSLLSQHFHQEQASPWFGCNVIVFHSTK